jgi:hypothetical protein
MTRNTKIALGCGGGGCLVLILIVIVCVVLIVTGVIKAPGIYSPSSNSNYNSNYNSNRNSNLNSNSNTNLNSNDNSNSNSSSSSSTISDDEKHKLVQAAGMANDTTLITKVLNHLGFVTDKGVSSDYAQFLQEHGAWAVKNTAWINSMRDPAKARAYVNDHLSD